MYRPARFNRGRNYAQMMGIALVLWCWTLFLFFKETPSWILLKTFRKKLKFYSSITEGAGNPCSIN
jgi:hypothetical protein